MVSKEKKKLNLFSKLDFIHERRGPLWRGIIILYKPRIFYLLPRLLLSRWQPF